MRVFVIKRGEKRNRAVNGQAPALKGNGELGKKKGRSKGQVGRTSTSGQVRCRWARTWEIKGSLKAQSAESPREGAGQKKKREKGERMREERTAAMRPSH